MGMMVWGKYRSGYEWWPGRIVSPRVGPVSPEMKLVKWYGDDKLTQVSCGVVITISSFIVLYVNSIS